MEKILSEDKYRWRKLVKVERKLCISVNDNEVSSESKMKIKTL